MFTGSLRAGSTNTALLHTAQVVAPAGPGALVYGGLVDADLRKQVADVVRILSSHVDEVARPPATWGSHLLVARRASQTRPTPYRATKLEDSDRPQAQHDEGPQYGG